MGQRTLTPASERVYVAGHRGLVGSALVRALRAAGYSDIVARTHRELDLEDAAAVHALVASERPALVGRGIAPVS